MSSCARMPSQYYPLLIAFAIALILGAVILWLNHLAAKSVSTGGRVKATTYESGLPLLDASRKRVSVLFFLVAIDFVIFDVEAAFLFPWAASIERYGTFGLVAMLIFIVLLLDGLVYAWKRGLLRWV